jgi:hypothetical protein
MTLKRFACVSTNAFGGFVQRNLEDENANWAVIGGSQASQRPVLADTVKKVFLGYRTI